MFENAGFEGDRDETPEGPACRFCETVMRRDGDFWHCDECDDEDTEVSR